MTLDEVFDCESQGKTVWYVGEFMYQYHAFPSRVIGVTASSCDDSEVRVENLFTGEEDTVSIQNLYPDPNQAKEIAAFMQKEHGSAIIPQKEYDEFLQWRNRQ